VGASNSIRRACVSSRLVCKTANIWTTQRSNAITNSTLGRGKRGKRRKEKDEKEKKQSQKKETHIKESIILVASYVTNPTAAAK
jgi:hypothetical protein